MPHNLLICCGPIPPGGTPGCCAGRYAPRECSYTTSTADYCHAHGGRLADPSGDCDKRGVA